MSRKYSEAQGNTQASLTITLRTHLEAPVAVLRLTRGGSGMAGSASWGAEGHPAGKGVWPGGLSTGAEKGPPESRSEELSSCEAWTSDLSLSRRLALCHPATLEAATSLCSLPAPTQCVRPHTVPLGASAALPPIPTSRLSIGNGLPFTFHFAPQIPGKTTWGARRAREIGGAVWLGADRESPGNCHMLSQCLVPAPPILFKEP